MKRAACVITFLVLLVAACAAQTPSAPDRSWQNGEPATQQNSSIVRGCLSGSVGNFTLTDQNGMQFRLVGGETALQSQVGHEIEVRGSESQTVVGNSEATAPSPANFQVTGVRNVGDSCKPQRDGFTPPPDH